MLRQDLTKAQEKCLRDQSITDEEPGSVLHDFRMLLDFVGLQGVEASGKHTLLPMKFIEELDGRLARPLRLELKRPQLKSHPYLMGLNLLLRCSGLSRVEGAGANTRLVIDPEMRLQWDQLNPTEQYFNLLEAWLRFGRAEMVGERGPFQRDLLPGCLQAWQSLPKEGKRFDLENPQQVYIPGLYRDLYMLALMDLFGLMGVELPRRPVSPWSPASIQHAPFGDALLTLLAPQLYKTLETVIHKEGEDEGHEEQALEIPRFGAWQPLFQPYFPEWRRNLELPESEPREGTFVFRVSLGKMWRLIAMPADATVDDLVHCILISVEFDIEHLYEFIYRNRLGGTVSISHPYIDEGPYTDEVLIGTLPLEPGQTMELHYDFGDDWRFAVRLERVEPPDVKIKAPRILEKHGKSPQQYGSRDE